MRMSSFDRATESAENTTGTVAGFHGGARSFSDRRDCSAVKVVKPGSSHRHQLLPHLVFLGPFRGFFFFPRVDQPP